MNPSLNTIMIGIAAGVAAAILSMGTVGQNSLAVLLYILSPLPILLAGLAWGPVAIAVSVLACAVSIAAVASSKAALVIVVTTALPAAIAAYLGGMARQADGRAEWFPLSVILLLVALTIATGFVISGYAIGYNEAFVRTISEDIAKQLASTNAELAADPAATDAFVNFLLASIPFLHPASWLLIMMGNLWLSLAIARRSGRFQRVKDNWPDELHLPVYAVGLLALAIIGAMLSKSFSTALLPYAGTLTMAFVMTGFALIHVVTRGKAWRPAALWFTYFGTFFFGITPIFLIAGLYRTAKHSAPNGSTH